MINWIVLLILPTILCACTIDTFVKDGSSASKDSLSNSEVVSIELRANGQSTDIYTSNDQTNYTLHQSIAGKVRGHSFFDQEYKGILKDEGFIVIEKTMASPTSWPNKSLWYVGSAPQTFEPYMDIAADISNCELFNHTDFLNMYCWDGNYDNRLIYQVDKHTKTIQSVLDKWGYTADSTYDFKIYLLETRSDARSETLAVYKVLKADTTVTELVDIYVYAGRDYQKVTIDPSDLNAIKSSTTYFSLTAQVTAGTDELVLVNTYDYNTGSANLLVIDISNPTTPTLRRYLNDLWYVGIIGNSVIFASGDDSRFKTYSTTSGLQDTTIPLGLSTNQVYGNTLVTTDGTSFKMCSLDGICTDFPNSRFLQGTSTKFYLIDNGLAEPDRVINSVDVATGAVTAETALTAIIRAQGMTMDAVSSISQIGDYLIVEQSNYRYLVFDKNATTIKADFNYYCSGKLSDITQNHKYRLPHFKGWNLMQTSFTCE